MINWFGPAAWDAPICREAPRCETPVGVPCGRCRKPIGENDCGVTMPFNGHGAMAFHHDCQMKAILPHTLWPAAGLIPDSSDGLIDGAFECRSCGMAYSTLLGWHRRLQ